MRPASFGFIRRACPLDEACNPLIKVETKVHDRLPNVPSVPVPIRPSYCQRNLLLSNRRMDERGVIPGDKSHGISILYCTPC